MYGTAYAVHNKKNLSYSGFSQNQTRQKFPQNTHFYMDYIEIAFLLLTLLGKKKKINNDF